MKRTRNNPSNPSSPPTCVLAADWHIRPTVPVCRTDDFLEAMWKKLDFILDLADHYKIPILLAGDIGLKSQWPNWLLEQFIRAVKSSGETKIYAIPGQHDLSNHCLDQWRQGAIGVLHEAGAIELLGVRGGDEGFIIDLNEKNSVFAFPYGDEIKDPGRSGGNCIAIAHTLITEGEPESFLIGKAENSAQSALSLLKKYPSFNIIITGDNHRSFIVEYEGRLLVNPGSMMRTTADQVDHLPRVYLWYAQENRVEAIYLPIEPGEKVIDRSHIDQKEQKDERIEAYISRLSEEVEAGLSFEGNLEAYFRGNRIKKPIQDKVWEAMQEK